MKLTLKLLATAAAALLVTGTTAQGWTKREHAAIALIAEQNLSPKTLKAVTRILEGRSISSYASWLDYYRADMQMKITKPYKDKMTRSIPHAFQVDAEMKAFSNPEMSCINVIEESIAKLGNPEALDDSTRLQCLLNVIHLVGDMHCPVHISYADKRDRGIGGFKIGYRGEKYGFHKVWDGMIVSETFTGGVDELARWAMTSDRKAVKSMLKGSLYDWGTEVAKASAHIFDIESGASVRDTYMYDNSAFVLSLLERAGYRLAYVLNSIFG